MKKDSIANRVKRFPRVITIHEPKEVENYIQRLSNKEIIVLKYLKSLAPWQMTLLEPEMERREQAHEASGKPLWYPPWYCFE